MIKNLLNICVLLLLFNACKPKDKPATATDNTDRNTTNSSPTKINNTALIILGTVQDAGSPQIGCKKDCCKDLFTNPDASRKVVSLGVIDTKNKATFLFEATPDIATQVKALKNSANFNAKETPTGIFLTHAHIGHYAGLMFLGKEAMNANCAAVYAMPKMKTYLENNGPWSQLVANKNIEIKATENNKKIQLTPSLKVVPFTVPHRDEFSETVGYTIIGPNKSALFIPDIDKWNKWEQDIIAEIAKVDYAFIDATFYDAEEINNRDISEIPHPFIVESMELFKELPKAEKSKINFIHFNHTNPALNIESAKAKQIIQNGFNIAQINGIYNL
ncbi:MAG: MBL fold metallo-hydrolase [Cellulophaga sp.]|uniref:MBL fold metallo-hydrolase n=1 Tax=Cellulophaga sp. TaxID=1972202 RepID=UPI003266FBD5